MTSVDPADFYTGIVAEIYGPQKSVSQDPEPYAAFIQQTGMPALELGCGDGDPLLELRRRGLDVDGVDSSADMLERLHRRADEQDIRATVFHQRMEALNLPRPSSFWPGPARCPVTATRQLRCASAWLSPHCTWPATRPIEPKTEARS